MGEKASLKEEVKKLINSFLCGYQKGATLKQLNNDYSMMEGTPIPFRKMGYTNVEDFLRSIPDAVTLSWERGECVVRAVANENNQRILNLVSKQKTTSRKVSRRPPPPRRSYAPNRAPPSSRYQQPRLNRHRPPPFQHRSGPPPPPPTVPHFILTKVRELFSSYKDGLNASNFEMAFSRRFGGRINFRELGFTSLYDFLVAMPDVVQLEKFAGGLYRIYAKTRPPEPSTDLPRRKSPPAHESRMLSVSDEEDSTPQASVQEVRVPQECQARIRQILEKHPNGIWSTKFTPEYKTTHGEELPFKRLGFHSVIELMSSIPAVVAIERPSSLDWLLFDARIKSRDAATRVRQMSQSSEGKVFSSGLERFQETLRQVLLAYKEGILLGELSTEFQELSGQPLPLEDLGFSDLDKLVSSESNQHVLSIKYEGHGQVFVYGIPTAKTFPNLLIKSPQPKEPKRKVPMDAVGPGNCYRPLVLPSDLQYVVVYVSNVESPGQFWVQLRGENTTDALEDLMDRLEDFYASSHCDDYCMPDSLVRPGQVCVALFPEDNNWHRVTITAVRQDGFVEVYYVDYGSTSCVSRNSVMMLKSQFLKLPAQALKARLANLQPAEGDAWPANARVKLLSLVTNKPMVAMPTNISEDGLISLCLCDTSGEEDIHLNDLLVASGLAKMLYDNYSEPMTTSHRPNEVLLGSPKGPLGEIHREQSTTANLKLRSVGASHSVTQQSETDQSENESESDMEQTEEEYIRNIKFVELTDRYSMHMIKLNDALYCSGAEVSAFIWEKDLLRPMLRQKKANFDKLKLNSSDQPEIFEELKEYKVKGTMKGEEGESQVTIFQLSVVIEILKIFNHPSQELIDAIQREIDRFDPEAPYWRGVDSEMESESEESSDLDLDRADLETACNHLQLQRKKILTQLRSDPAHVTTYVDELDMVERQLVEVRGRINQLSQTKENQTDLTEEEKFVQLCVQEQYKDMPAPASKTKSKDKPSKQVPPVVKEKTTSTSQACSSPGKKTNPVAPMPVKMEEPPVVPEAPPTSDKVGGMFAGLSLGGGVSSQQQPQPAYQPSAFSAFAQQQQPPRMATTAGVGGGAYGLPTNQNPAMGGSQQYPPGGSSVAGPIMVANQLPPEQQQMLLQYQLAIAQMAMTQQNMGVMAAAAATMRPGMQAYNNNSNAHFQTPSGFNHHQPPQQHHPGMVGQSQYGPFSTMHPLGTSQHQVFGNQPNYGGSFSAPQMSMGTGEQYNVGPAQEAQSAMQYGPRSIPRPNSRGGQ